MYRIINEDYKVLFGNKIFKKHFEDYKVIIDRLKEEDVSKDSIFQRKYKAFYGMRYQSVEFCNVYFELLERSKNKVDIDLKDIIQKLFQVDGKYEFSFATKLLHTVCQTQPIYDSNIGKFFNIDISNRKKETRYKDTEKVYGFLQFEYKRVLAEKLLAETLLYLRAEYNLMDITDEKIIDSIIWGYIKFTKFNFSELERVIACG